MYFSPVHVLLSLVLATLTTAAPHTTKTNASSKLVTFVMSEPDCPSIKDYCKNCGTFVSP